MKDKKDLKPLPVLKTDEEAERFVDEADLSEYDLSGFQPVRFEFQRKAASIHLRLPQQLLEAVKKRAAEAGIPYQRLIRQAIEKEIGKPH
jgi:predicted DNA binding CopG/RHH family protein